MLEKRRVVGGEKFSPVVAVPSQLPSMPVVTATRLASRHKRRGDDLLHLLVFLVGISFILDIVECPYRAELFPITSSAQVLITLVSSIGLL